jgi:hypothetical protein
MPKRMGRLLKKSQTVKSLEKLLAERIFHPANQAVPNLLLA